jgi:myb proto-oncogene protein
VSDTHPDTVATSNWIKAVANTSKKKYGKEYKTDWDAVAALVPGRTKIQCNNRWHDFLDPSIDRSNERTGSWTAVEDAKLKDAVQEHGSKNWDAIATLVPGRTKIQCNKRWHDALDPSIDRANERTGKWTTDEDSKLKDAVQTHGSKNWGAIAALVPGRTLKQCNHRWHHISDTSIDRANGRKGKWTEAEDSQLKHAVKTHDGKDWVAISVHVPGRTKDQCCSRWRDMKPNRSTVRGKARSTLKKAPAWG